MIPVWPSPRVTARGSIVSMATRTGAVAGTIAGAVLSGVTRDGVVTKPGNIVAGAVVGAGAGALVSAVTPGPGIWIPSESEIDFHLAAPVTVSPVSAKEAARLSQGLHTGGPLLYVRGDQP